MSRLVIFCAALLIFVAACRQAPGPLTDPASGDAPSRASSPVVPAPRYDLSRDEQRGGHTLEKHVGRTDEQLRERLARERISAASTWTDRETAETTVAQTLHAERRRVENWMRRGYPRANLALHYDASRPIGRSMRRGQEQNVDCSSAVVVLRADGPDSCVPWGPDIPHCPAVHV